ncbi:hypothetical protein PSZ80_24215, partial [Shigella sonnei]|nr:hypothetical protein [Shigella sonnei]
LKKFVELAKNQTKGFITFPKNWIGGATLTASSTNFLSRLTPMKFDDLDEGMTRDEIEYLLNTNDEALDANEREMIT